jgi:hypothetical protein
MNDMTVARRPKSELSDERDEDAIFSVDTVPPPAGEDDAYSAATKVGPLARGYIEKLMADSERKPSPPRMRSGAVAVSDRSEIRSLVVPKPPRTPSDSRPGMPTPAPAAPRSPGAYSAREEEDDDDYFFRAVDNEEPPHEPTSLFGAFSDAGADVARFEEAMLRSVTEEIDRRKPEVLSAAPSSSKALAKALAKAAESDASVAATASITANDATEAEKATPVTPAGADAPVVVARALAAHRTRALLVAVVLVCAALAAFYAATRG